MHKEPPLAHTVNSMQAEVFLLRLSSDYRKNVDTMHALLRVDDSFDLIERTLTVGKDEMTLYYIDGFVKDGEMQRIMQYFFGLEGLGEGQDAARVFASSHVPYVEVDCTEDTDTLITMVLSGATALLGSTFGGTAIVIDARTYPSRSTEEPSSDKVIQGSHDGFVETLIFNTALIRRRLRTPNLTVKYTSVGSESRSDIALVYMEDRVDREYRAKIEERLSAITAKNLAMGTQSLTEVFVPRRWYNPFPKVRLIERPDAAAACISEGSIILLCDTSPQAMVLPTAIFDFLQESDDYYMPPLTGTYLRVLRILILILSFCLTPTWYLLLQNREILPPALAFILPQDTGALPILLQLLLVELAVDGLKLASMNTPDLLANSLSVIGALLLGEFAVSLGWLSEAVIFYMAVVTIAAFSQQNYELGYAIKFLRIITLLLTALLGVVGYVLGLVIVSVCLLTNRTASGTRGYLYPLFPFNGKALLRLLIRLPKSRVDGKQETKEQKK